MNRQRVSDRQIADELYATINRDAYWSGLSMTYLRKAVGRSATRVLRILEADPRFEQTYRRKGESLDFSRPIWAAIDLKARAELQRTLDRIRQFEAGRASA